MGLAYAVDTSGDVNSYQADTLGSVRVLSDYAGNVVQTYQTDEFGVATQSQGSVTQPFQYTGEQRDAESGFVYLRARVYDPSVGRFLSRDPVAGALASPLTLNRHSYVENNPVSATDPSGLSSSRALADGSTDNDCFSSAGGTLGGNVVFARCLDLGFGAQAVVAVINTPIGPRVVSTVLFAKPPSGGGSPGEGSDNQLPDRRWLTRSGSRVKKVLGLTDQQFSTAIHQIKSDIPGNPDVAVDVRNGDVYDLRSGEPIGNLLDYR